MLVSVLEIILSNQYSWSSVVHISCFVLGSFVRGVSKTCLYPGSVFCHESPRRFVGKTRQNREKMPGNRSVHGIFIYLPNPPCTQRFGIPPTPDRARIPISWRRRLRGPTPSHRPAKGVFCQKIPISPVVPSRKNGIF